MKKIWPLPAIEIKPFQEIRETREVVLVYSQAAWDAVGERIDLPVVSRLEIREATESHWQQALDGLQGEVIYTVGGGLTADAGKYIATKKNLPLVCLPTALTVDAFLTWASGVRRNGCVAYLETKPPDIMIADWDVLGSAPAPLRAAGICDVLSIATGCWDWKYAEVKNLNAPDAPFCDFAYQTAEAILQGAFDCAEAAGRGDPEGLKQLLDCLSLEVQLCNLIGHARPEEGSEHYFAYAVESVLGRVLPHGDLVGPGILLIAQLQGQDTAPLKKALDACHIPLDTIPPDAVRKTLQELPAYCRRHDLPHGLAHDLTPQTIDSILANRI